MKVPEFKAHVLISESSPSLCDSDLFANTFDRAETSEIKSFRNFEFSVNFPCLPGHFPGNFIVDLDVLSTVGVSLTSLLQPHPFPAEFTYSSVSSLPTCFPFTSHIHTLQSATYPTSSPKTSKRYSTSL